MKGDCGRRLGRRCKENLASSTPLNAFLNVRYAPQFVSVKGATQGFSRRVYGGFTRGNSKGGVPNVLAHLPLSWLPSAPYSKERVGV